MEICPHLPMPTLRSNMKSVILPPPHRAAETTPSIALRSVCCSFVHAGQLDRADVERQLIDACTANGLMDDPDNGGIKNILRTIRSAEAGAIAKPRRPR